MAIKFKMLSNMRTKKITLNFYLTVLFIIFSFYPAEGISSISPTADKIPDSIVSLTSGYIIVVDKQYQKLYVFHKDGTFSKIFETSCSTGKNQGSKQVVGDAKTPNGIFFITKVLQNPGPPEIYGSIAFPLDYPTISDKRAGKNGGNIWIHGTAKTLLPTQSNGCVVLHDNDIKRLAGFIFLNRTPVIISESLTWIPQNSIPPSKSELEKILMSWHRAFVENDIKTIDALYINGSEIKGKRRDELNKKIRYLKKINKHFALQPRDISIFQVDNNAVITFDQIFSVNNNNSFQGFYNKLILEKVNNKWYVVDDATPPPSIASENLAQVNTTKNTSMTIHEESVRKLVNKWTASWESGDMKTYRDCYTPDFQSNEMNLDAWILYKTNVRRSSENIKIRVDNLQISVDENVAVAVFTQDYSSSILKSKGKKKLELKKVNNEWKIFREIMRPYSTPSK
jgi:murein L,D-transpeptidase YafK